MLKYLYTALLLVIIFSSCRVIPKEYSLNESVKQKVEARTDTSVIIKPGALYEAGGLKRFLLGDHYRDVWTTPVEIPILNFEKEKGGLEILKRGGGMQTYSLKLKAKDGHLYSLRSIQKDPSPTLPKPLQYSFADDIVQDQISASHPFGAVILPSLGDAAGIYHTNPKLVYIPDSPILGKHQEAFGGVLAMIEEDADEDWSDYEDFGNTKNAVGFDTMLEDINDDNENSVDQESLLRVRLFDIWINDWDRHDGQFRWGEFETERGIVFRPIPEDRDNVFFKFDGFFPWFVSRKWAMRKFQTFKEEIRDLPGLNHNARYLDRRFLTNLEQEDWVKMANELQNKLSDKVIEDAIGNFPDDIYKLNGEKFIKILKARRDKLVEFAKIYYSFLAKEVDIVGSNNNELVEVNYSDSEASIKMYNASEEGEKKELIYDRTFFANETDEVRVYTQGDEDFINITGTANDAPKLRLIGGQGEDIIKDESQVKGAKNNLIYDTEEGNEIEAGSETKLKLSNSLDVNAYDYRSFKYNYFGPAVYFGYNQDDGVYLGGGVVIRNHGFRKDPYASYHKIAVNLAPNSMAWNFDYEGDWNQVFGGLGLNFEAQVRAPNYYSNFYGYGNETEIDDSRNDDYYEVRYKEAKAFLGITYKTSTNSTLKFGPYYQFVDVGSSSNNFVSNEGQQFDDEIFESSHYLGGKLVADITSVDDLKFPLNGVRWKTELLWQAEMYQESNKYSRIKSELSAYYTFEEPIQITLATRIGGASNAGTYDFYQANTIGGNAGFSRKGNVRGYERDRFSGRSNVFQNNEIRIRLIRLPFYYLPMSIGISGHFDQGRVWADGEESSEWHSGYGGGLWFRPLGMVVLTATYTKSEEDNLVMLNLGIMF